VRLAILGGPGAGKGTQAKQLSQFLGLTWVSTGEGLRQEIAASTDLGQQVQTQILQGDLVPDEAVIGWIRDRLVQPDVLDGWILDGYPRTAFQAEELDFLLDDLQQRLELVVWLEVPEAVLMERSLAMGRLDDQPATIQRRIQQFRERSSPLIEYYEFNNRLLQVDGNQAIERVHQEILARLVIGE